MPDANSQLVNHLNSMQGSNKCTIYLSIFKSISFSPHLHLAQVS